MLTSRPAWSRGPRAGEPIRCAPRPPASSARQHGGDRIVFRPLGRIKVKGRSQAVPIHEIVGLEGGCHRPHARMPRHLREGLEKYFACDFADAIARFKCSAELEPHIPGRDPGIVSNPSLVYIEHFRAFPNRTAPGGLGRSLCDEGKIMTLRPQRHFRIISLTERPAGIIGSTCSV